MILHFLLLLNFGALMKKEYLVMNFEFILEKIQFSVPISYPFKTDGCKDKKAIVITKCFI